MPLKTPYATTSEADAYFNENDTWLDLDTSVKENHLLNGMYYIDNNYSCAELIDGEEIPEEYTYANSLLALEDSLSSIFTVDSTGHRTVIKTRVKAGEVESEKEYDPGSGKVDPYPQVSAVLASECYLSANSVQVTIVRQ